MPRVELLPHQRTAADKLSNGKVLVGGVGTGKTVTALAYYWEKVLGGILDDWDTVQTPVDIYILTTARKRDDLDWQRWGVKFGIASDTEYSLLGIKLTVDSYNNIEKYEGVKDAFFIFDEQRLVGAGSWSKAFIKISKANRWILLSATPGDTWEDYIPLFVANGFYKNRSEFKREHIVYVPYQKFPKIQCYLGEGKLLRLKRSILVEMPYERHTTRHIHETIVDHDVELFEKVVKNRWHVYEERPLRDVAELFTVMRKVVNSDESRLNQIRNLLYIHPRLIVFYNFDYELNILRSLISPSQTNSLNESTESGEKRNSSWIFVPTFVSTSSLQKDDWCPNQPSCVSLVDQTTSPLTQRLTSTTPIEMSGEESEKSLDLSSSLTMTRSSDSADSIHSKRAKSYGSSRSHSSVPIPREDETWLDSPEKSLKRLLESNSKIGNGRRSLDSNAIKPISKLQKPTFPGLINYPNIGDGIINAPETKGLRLSCSIPNCGAKRVENGVLGRSHQFSSDGTEEQRTTGNTTATTRKPTDFLEPTSSNVIIQVAEWNGHRHDPIPTSDRWVYLVQYVAGAEAWDCITTNTVVFYSLTYSYKNFIQAQGRIDRLNTPYLDLHYYVLCSNSGIDKAIMKSLKNKQDFNERDFAK